LTADEFAIPADEPDIEEGDDPADAGDYDPADVEHDEADTPQHHREKVAILASARRYAGDADLHEQRLLKLEVLVDIRDALYELCDHVEYLGEIKAHGQRLKQQQLEEDRRSAIARERGDL
jgi:hypothetical protein